MAPSIENPKNDDKGEQEGIQGMLAIYFHFIYISNPLPPSPQPQPVSLHGKHADTLPLASHSSPYPSPTTQTLELEHALVGTF